MTKTLVFIRQFFLLLFKHFIVHQISLNVTFFSFLFFVQQQCIINKLNVQNLSHEFFLLLLGERMPGGEVDFLFAA